MLKKICGFLSGILLIVLEALAGILIIPKVMGYEEMAVLTGSMEPKYPVGSLIFVKEENLEKLQVGDVITYRLSGDTVVTHRVVEMCIRDSFNTVIWAMITDVIDDAEVKNGVREDGTVYAVYSFARKLGQAFSSGMIGGLLSLVGYTEKTAFDPVVIEGIFKISCIVPIVGLIAVALALIFIYPLNKKRVEENAAELARRRGEK